MSMGYQRLLWPKVFESKIRITPPKKEERYFDTGYGVCTDVNAFKF